MKKVKGLLIMLVVFVVSLVGAPTGKIKIVGIPDKYKANNQLLPD